MNMMNIQASRANQQAAMAASASAAANTANAAAANAAATAASSQRLSIATGAASLESNSNTSSRPSSPSNSPRPLKRQASRSRMTPQQAAVAMANGMIAANMAAVVNGSTNQNRTAVQMALAHAHENPVVADDARMPYNEPVHFALNLRTDNGHRFGIEGKQVSDILLFHFRTVLFVSLLCRLRIAR